METLPETGPLELRELVASVNRMSQQIHDLLANRTTLLSGISHDLRTPLTRMERSIEMLQEKTDPMLVTQLRHDIDHMNKLINQFLDFSSGLQEGSSIMVDMWLLCSLKSPVITNQPIPDCASRLTLPARKTLSHSQ